MIAGSILQQLDASYVWQLHCILSQQAAPWKELAKAYIRHHEGILADVANLKAPITCAHVNMLHLCGKHV